MTKWRTKESYELEKQKSKNKLSEKIKTIRANRRDNTEAWSIIFTNIESEKSKVFVPDWLKYLFG